MNKGDVIGDYQIEDRLGNGAFGVVYRARHTPTNELVALKIDNSPTPEDLARFHTENDIMHTLTPHRHILEPKSRIMTAGVPSRYFYAMELADTTLPTHLYRNSQATFPELINIFKEICHGLKHAHNYTIAHRDLHLGNVLLKLDQNFVVKLTDFGKAKNLTATNMTPSDVPCWGWLVRPPEVNFNFWNAPTISEFIVGDMYALGILLFTFFGGAPHIYVTGLQGEIDSYKDQNDFDTIPRDRREKLYRNWISTVQPNNQFLSVQRMDQNETDSINRLLKRLSHIDLSQRCQSVEQLELELATIHI